MNLRIIVCPHCGGDKGHDVPYDIDRRDGSTIDRWERCRLCDATGDVEIEVEPIELEDFPSCYGERPAMHPDEADNFIMDTERVCLDLADGKIDRATARARLIAIGMIPEIVDEGLDEQERQKPP